MWPQRLTSLLGLGEGLDCLLGGDRTTWDQSFRGGLGTQGHDPTIDNFTASPVP